jgi:recombination protein RecA
MFYHRRTMVDTSLDVSAVLATLRDRWGAAAPQRLGTDGGGRDRTESDDRHGSVMGSLATVPLPADGPSPLSLPADGRIVPTGFAALDAILGPGGIPRRAGLAVRGDHSSGKTTLALRLVAEAQAAGSIVAWLDLDHGLDPVEAVARGVRLEWLIVLAPDTLDEGLAMAGALLQGRAVDLLVADLTTAPRSATTEPRTGAGPSATTAGPSAAAGQRRPRGPSTADRLHRLAALARRADVLLVVLAPPGLPAGLTGAVGESTGVHLELARQAWIRLGRDVVGQRIEVNVARNRFGPLGRRAELRILYAQGGERDDCLRSSSLLREIPTGVPPGGRIPATASPSTSDAPIHPIAETPTHATAPSLLAAPAPPPRPIPLRVVPDRAARPRRPAVGPGARPRRRSRGDGDGRPARDAPGRGASTGT